MRFEQDDHGREANRVPFVSTMRTLEYRVEVSSKRRGRLWYSLLLFVLTLIIWGLWDLEHAPYRPPHDMSTLLGAPELAFVRGAIRVVGLMWMATLVGLAWTWRKGGVR